MLDLAVQDLKQLKHSPPFCCLGAAHEDVLLRLKAPLMEGRTNPVARSSAPGGVACSIAIRIAQLGIPAILSCLPPPPIVRHALNEAGVVLRTIGRKKCTARYTAVLTPEGELQEGYAAMEQYDRVGPDDIVRAWPPDISEGLDCVAVIDANFSTQAISYAVAAAHGSEWLCMGHLTSSAKVERMTGNSWHVLSGNETETCMLAEGEGPDFVTNWLAVTRKGMPQLLSVHEETYTQEPPEIAGANANGAGAAFAAVLFASGASGIEPERALALATAAGAAAEAGLWPLVGKKEECSLENALKQMGTAGKA